jgi:hypothetical protein
MDTRRPTAATDVGGRPHPGHQPSDDLTRVRGQVSEQFQAARDEARSTAQQVGGAAADAASRAKEAAAGVAEQVQQTAGDYARQAQAHGRDMLDQQRQRVAAQVRTAAEAAQRAADRFREDHDDNIASVIQTFGTEVNRLGDYLDRQDLNGLWRDAQSFARRRPELFLGGMFVAGLALSRFLKASADHDHDHDGPDRAGPSSYAGYYHGGETRYGNEAQYGSEADYDASRYRVPPPAGGYAAGEYSRQPRPEAFRDDPIGREPARDDAGAGGGWAAAAPASIHEPDLALDAGTDAADVGALPRVTSLVDPAGVTDEPVRDPTASGAGAPLADAAAGSGPAAAATGITAVSVHAPSVYTLDVPASDDPTIPTLADDEPDARRLPPEVH